MDQSLTKKRFTIIDPKTGGAFGGLVAVPLEHPQMMMLIPDKPFGELALFEKTRCRDRLREVHQVVRVEDVEEGSMATAVTKRPIHEQNFRRFCVVYDHALRETREKNPEAYAWPLAMTSIVAQRMAEALRTGSYNHDGLAIKLTCKRLGLRHTRTAIENFIREET